MNEMIFQGSIVDDPEKRVFDVKVSVEGEEWVQGIAEQRAAEGLVTSVAELFQFANRDVIDVLLSYHDETTNSTKQSRYSVLFIFEPSAMVVSH